MKKMMLALMAMVSACATTTTEQREGETLVNLIRQPDYTGETAKATNLSIVVRAEPGKEVDWNDLNRAGTYLAMKCPSQRAVIRLVLMETRPPGENLGFLSLRRTEEAMRAIAKVGIETANSEMELSELGDGTFEGIELVCTDQSTPRVSDHARAEITIVGPQSTEDQKEMIERTIEAALFVGSSCSDHMHCEISLDINESLTFTGAAAVQACNIANQVTGNRVVGLPPKLVDGRGSIAITCCAPPKH